MDRPRVHKKAQAVLDKALETKTRWTATELMQRPRVPLQWTVKGLWAPGITLLGGAHKDGKSVLALQLAGAVAKGEDVLGRKTRQSSVLYISTDEPSPDIFTRQAFPFMPEGTAVTIDFSWPSLDAGGLDRLVTFLKDQPKYGAVVIDTLQKCLSDRVGKGYGRDTQIMGALTNAIASVGRPVAVLVTHHVVKKVNANRWEESFYGTSGIPAGAQNLWHIAKAAPEAPVEGPYVFNAKGRSIRHESFRLMRKLCYFEELVDPEDDAEDSHAYEWVIDDSAPVANTSSDTTAHGIIRVLQSVDGALKQAELLEKLAEREHCPHSRQYIVRHVDRLVAAGIIFKQGTPHRPEYIHPENLPPANEAPSLRKRLNKQ